MSESDFRLKAEVLEPGDGKTYPRNGDELRVTYSGRFEDGRVFDTNEGKEPLTFKLGTKQVIEGWEALFSDVSLGEKAKLFIPSRLAYGEEGYGDAIPKNSNLIFDIHLREIIRSKPKENLEKSLTEEERKAVSDSFIPETYRSAGGRAVAKTKSSKTKSKRKKKN